ncbi:putative Chaperone protein DnaK [Cocos nucifera]|uniref:Putative Chaperone protein DnaK n=1 Tax=Cocos nucifera TaxID=13894 RepID=A0A8K0I474_COCNU|nr:putative Chaperone protein DnaK [Cocos nucifera]
MASHQQLLAFANYFVIFVSFALILSSLYFVKKKSAARKRAQERERARRAIALSGAQDLPDWLPPPNPPLPGGDQKEAAAATMAGGGGQGERQKGEEKRKKKRGKKKRQESGGGLEGGEEAKVAAGAEEMGKAGAGKAGSIYPFSSFASATQRKIKVQYDQLVKSNQAKALTVAQVGQFINCLIEARNELQHKSDIIQRSFKIKKALLVKADRSSFDRLAQQIYKLEAEHKRLEEDAAVYNLLQEQLKLSPAYNKMLEISSNVELKATSDQETEARELPDISFEELLAQEKKDSFWQKNGKLRSFAS